MAIFTSHNGNFQVEAISFTPDVIAKGEEVSYSISIKNISGKNITRLIMGMRLRFKDRDGVVRSSDDSRVFGQLPLESSPGYWNNGQTVTFTGSFKLTSYYELDNSARVLPVYRASDVGYDGDGDVGLVLDITTDAVLNGMQNSDLFYNLRGANSEYLTVLDGRYTPAIPVFAAERSSGETSDDEGENLLTSLRLTLSDRAFPERLLLLLRYRDKAGAANGVMDISSLMDAALTDETTTLIRETFDKNTDWKLSLWFGDTYESAEAEIEVPKSFANVHLSGASTGGVCFGGFSKAEEGKPLFQCYYPSQFHGGIDGVNNFVLGEVKTGGRWLDGMPVYRSVFAFDFPQAGSGLEIGRVEGVGTLVGMDGSVKWDDSDAPFQLPLTHYLAANNYHQVFFMGDVLVMNTANACSGHVIVDYTKAVEEASE